jgi:hypothetical protein
MIVQLDAIFKKPDWTISQLSIDGTPECFTVEDEIRDKKVHGETAIWAGKYLLSKRWSPSMSKAYRYNPTNHEIVRADEYARNPRLYKSYTEAEHPMIHITNIKQFDLVMFHWGNTDDDSLGCPIVGAEIGIIKGQQGVLNSRRAYENFYPKVMKAIVEGNAELIVTR